MVPQAGEISFLISLLKVGLNLNMQKSSEFSG